MPLLPAPQLAARLAALVALTFAGCSLLGVGDDIEVDDLAPGTFRFRAGDRTYEGAATYDPATDRQSDQAAVFLVPDQGTVMVILSDAFLTAQAGDRIAARVDFRPVSAFYQAVSGSVEVTAASAGGIEGWFRFRLEDSSTGPGQSPDLTAEGAFRAALFQE